MRYISDVINEREQGVVLHNKERAKIYLFCLYLTPLRTKPLEFAVLDCLALPFLLWLLRLAHFVWINRTFLSSTLSRSGLFGEIAFVLALSERISQVKFVHSKFSRDDEARQFFKFEFKNFKIPICSSKNDDFFRCAA